MRTVEDILSAFHLTETDITLLSGEAREHAVGCGKRESSKDLSQKTWDLFDELSETVWQSSMPTGQKIELGFRLFELFPDYYHFLVPFYHLIRSNGAIAEDQKQLVWKQFMDYLGADDHYADPVGYVLWVEFFEDPETVVETWNGLIRSVTKPSVLLRLLEHAGPVPYELKEQVYKELLADPGNHETIFKSLLYGAFDVYGKLDKDNALKLLSELTIDRDTSEYKQLMLKLK
ncbi:MAG TPA: hypothetical protein PKD26_12575 [Pyrinomonadaceae bacterium]|nr:hypothetical protein [Pyrinomonadaceae bacterium]